LYSTIKSIDAEALSLCKLSLVTYDRISAADHLYRLIYGSWRHFCLGSTDTVHRDCLPIGTLEIHLITRYLGHMGDFLG